MFEQASLDTRGALRNPWTLTISVLGQTVAVGAGILVSLIHTDTLPRSLFFTSLVAPGVPAGPPPKQPESPVPRQVRPSSTRIFTAPSRIPRAIQMSGPETGLAPPSESVGGEIGIPGGLGTGTGLIGAFIDAIPRPAPPPRQDTVAQSKPPAPVVVKPTPVSSGVQAAKLIRQVNPVYPPLAVSARISGTVRLAAIVARDGTIKNLQVVSGHPLLTAAAVEAVKQWLYRSTLLNHEPMEDITQIDVNFTLSR